MPVEFLTDDEAAAYGRYVGDPSQADLERVFFLDDEDMDLVNQHRGDHMKVGFALQLVTVRWLGTFLDNPLDVPATVLEFVAGQLSVADPLVVNKYGERVKTLSDHQLEIRRAEGLRDFTEAQEDLAAWVAARSWTSGDGPKAIFLDAITWMRERKILLPGVSRLARLVARVRDDTTHRLWAELEGLLTPVQRRVLDQLLEVPPGKRVSDLERWRKGPPPRGSGPAIIAALDQVAEIQSLGLADLGAESAVPPRRLGELARYGMTADAWLIRRHPDDRRLATLLATARHLEAKSVDDALELLDLLMSAELLNKAQREADKDKARKHPRLARASARLAVAVEALFDSDGWGGPDEEPRVSQVWEAIEAVVSRADLRAALTVVSETAPPPGAEDPDDWRAELLGRYQMVIGFLKLLPAVISFGATAEGAPVLAAMQALPDVLAYRSRLPAPLIPGKLIRVGVVTGPWRRLVLGHPAHEGGAVSRHAYAFCVLEQFWRGLKRRDIYADASTRWRNPQARLLEGQAWAAIRGDVLTMTWFNAMNDRGMGRGAKVVSGTVRDSLHMVDVIFGLDGGELPEIVVSDTGSYSDVVFGLLELLGISYRPALADLPDQKGWRIRAEADYGPLNTFARGKVDLTKIRRNWEDILRVVASIYTGTVRAYDVVTMLQRDGHPTALGEAIAMYGRIFKSLHILSYIDTDETYRRDIKGIRNLQEGRHALARKICHGKKGELYHRYERGLENQLGSLGLVLNCVTLWTTVYLDAAVRQLRDQGYPIRDEDMARLSPFVSRHLGVHGIYTFALPDLALVPSASCATPTPPTRTTSSAFPRSAAAVGVGGRHERGDGVLAGLDVLLQGGQPLVAADGHEQGGADVLVAEVGEPGVPQLVQGLAAGVALEQLLGHLVGQPRPAGFRVQVGGRGHAMGGGPPGGEEDRAGLAAGGELSQEPGGAGLEVQRPDVAALDAGAGAPVAQAEVGDVQAEGLLGAAGGVVQQPPQRPLPQRDGGPRP